MSKNIKDIIGCKCNNPNICFSTEINKDGVDRLYLYCTKCEKINRYTQKTIKNENKPKTIATKIICQN